jgi:nicotinamidase-related amidase
MFKQENSVLLIIDVQGRLAQMMHKRNSLFKHIKIMIQAAQILNIPILWVEQYPQGLGKTVKEIGDLLKNQKAHNKTTFSSCGDSAFYKNLYALDRKQLIVTGIETHVCVYQTVIDLLQANFTVAVNQDAVSSRKKSNKLLGLERLVQAGAIKTSTEMLLFEIMKTSEHPEFKKISSLLK